MKTTKVFLYLTAVAAFTLASCNNEDDPTQTGEFIEIPDLAFRDYCLKNFDRNGDGKIREGEAAVVTEMDVRELRIHSLTGIEHFVALEKLRCDKNNLATIDVSKNTALQTLSCNDNKIDSLDLSQNTVLKELFCNKNQLTSLDLSKNVALTNVSCYQNKLKDIDISSCINLQILRCSENNFIWLDVSNNRKLTYFWCQLNDSLAVIYIWQGCDPVALEWVVSRWVTYVVVEDE